MMTTLLALLLVLGMTPVLAQDLRLVTTRDEQTGVGLTIYSNLALVHERREVDLPIGIFELEFQDVARTITPSSVAVVTDDESLRVLEQSYRFDLLNKQTLLERFLGRKLKYSRTVREGMRFEKVLREGTLLSINPEVVQFGDEIEIEPEGIISLSYLPDDLKTTPTLLWRLDNDTTGTRELTVSYLAEQLSWHADYVLTLANTRGNREVAKLIAWVTLENHTGASFEEARVSLIAGDVRRSVPSPMPQAPMMERMVAMSADTSAGGLPTEESFADHHLYRLLDPVSIDNNTIKQVKLLELEDIRVSRQYVVEQQVQLHQYNMTTKPRAEIHLEFKTENDEAIPLPAGSYRVYQEDGNGELLFVGEDQAGHTAPGEDIDLVIGSAFDLVIERKQTVFRRINNRAVEVGYAITVRNRGSKDAELAVREKLQGDWDVTQKRGDGKRLDSSTYVFDLKLAPGQETTVSYNANVRF